MTLLVALLAASPFPPDVAHRLIQGAREGVAYERLAELTDTIGPRLSGSPGAEAAVKWALAQLEADGLEARLEPVKVPHWVRGEEHGEVLAPEGGFGQPLALTALGGSVPTPAGGVTAEVVEVHSIEEAAALGERGRGRIVFYNFPMIRSSDYGRFVVMRGRGPSAAARVGAVGVLIRSLATASLRSPHTGATSYEEGVTKIPAAAISVEDAGLLHRRLQRGPVKVRFALGCKTLPDADSFNVVGEVRGREKPDEIVLMGGHLDSWDLAQGANDDGAGVAMLMDAARLIARLPQHPRRTVRVVFFMNEENGLAGGKAYAAAHGKERHAVAMESDSGSARPLSINVRSGEGGAALLRPWLAPLDWLNLDVPGEGEAGGADISPLLPLQVPMAGVAVDGTHYFDIHHTAADTLDKISPNDLADDTAAWAVLAYALAEMPETLPQPPPAPARVRPEQPLRPAAH